MKRTIVCGIFLVLLGGAAFAQRRAVEPGALPSRGKSANVGPVAPNVGMTPAAVGMGHDGVAPNATNGNVPKTAGASSTTSRKTVQPNATSGAAAPTVQPN